MTNWRRTRPAPSRLESGREVYSLVLGIAEDLDAAGLDLWAGGLRSCLDASTTLARQQHLVVELVRLRGDHGVRRAGCVADVMAALDRLLLGLGTIDVPEQPLYAAARGLADHLELSGGRRWLARLRTVVADPERGPAARLARLEALLRRMVPDRDAVSAGTALPDAVPAGTADRVRAVQQRLVRHPDADTVLRYVGFALTPPVPSRLSGTAAGSG